MELKEKNAIYDRLLAIRVEVNPDPVPKPWYINEKIWECHKYIEEVSSYNIRVTREISALQQALNNSQAEYQTKKEALLSSDEEIRLLPNIRDREARANQKLCEEQARIKNYQNELNDLNNLLRAIDLKLKNLNRINGDIRLQVRVLESQIKLEALPNDSTLSNLANEIRKGIKNEDIISGSSSEYQQENIMDPTQPLEIKKLFGDEGVDQALIEPVPDIAPKEETSDENEDDEPIEVDMTVSDDSFSDPTIDLDKVIESKKEGGEPEESKAVSELKVVKSHKVDSQKSSGIDLDDLLDKIITNERKE